MIHTGLIPRDPLLRQQHWDWCHQEQLNLLHIHFGLALGQLFLQKLFRSNVSLRLTYTYNTAPAFINFCSTFFKSSNAFCACCPFGGAPATSATSGGLPCHK